MIVVVAVVEWIILVDAVGIITFVVTAALWLQWSSSLLWYLLPAVVKTAGVTAIINVILLGIITVIFDIIIFMVVIVPRATMIVSVITIAAGLALLATSILTLIVAMAAANKH